MKTQNILLPLAAFAAGALLAKRNNSSSIGGMKKYIVTATAPTHYQLRSVSAFGSPKKNPNGSFTFEEVFDSYEDAKEYLLERVSIYYSDKGNAEEEQDAINDINKYGSVTFDAVRGGIYEM